MISAVRVAVITAVTTVLIPDVVFSQTTGNAPIKTVRISGWIKDETGAPLASAILKCSNANHREDFSTTTDTDRRFTYSVASHNEYEIYRVESSAATTFTDIGKIMAAGVEEIKLGHLALQFSPKHEPVVKLEGSITVSGPSMAPRTHLVSSAAMFVGAGGTANIIDDGGTIFQLPTEKDQVDYASAVGWMAGRIPFLLCFLSTRFGLCCLQAGATSAPVHG